MRMVQRGHTMYCLGLGNIYFTKLVLDLQLYQSEIGRLEWKLRFMNYMQNNLQSNFLMSIN